MTDPTYTLYVPLLDLVKITDISADAVYRFLSNRIDTTRYSVVGTDGTNVRGDEWLAAVHLRAEAEAAKTAVA